MGPVLSHIRETIKAASSSSMTPSSPTQPGGRPTIENIELRCRAHNDDEADVFYGPGRRDGGVEALREREATYGRVIGDSFRSGTTIPGSHRPSFRRETGRPRVRRDRRAQPNDHRGGPSPGAGAVSPRAMRSSHPSSSARWAARSNPK